MINYQVELTKVINTAVLEKKDVLIKVRDMIQSIPDLNIREKARLYLAAKKYYDAGLAVDNNRAVFRPANKIIYRFSVAVNKVLEHKNSRLRKNKLKGQLRDSRATGGIFFMSSYHSNAAEDHKDYQGQIYVDRFWKATLKDDKSTVKKVQAYIRNRGIITVQELCSVPVYFITRPYCKHFMIPLDTFEVLNNGIVRIRKNHPEAKMKTHNVDYRKKFYKTRYRIHTVLGMKGEAARDKKVIQNYGK